MYRESETPTWISFPAHDQPHPGGTANEEVAGEFGDPGAVADLAVGFDRRGPGRGRNLQNGVVDGVGDRHPDRVGQPPAPRDKPVQEVVGPVGGWLVKARG
ncbi:hypothetical protein GCM10009639_35300 [Kitasatospora putterlickiae]|uniref:Uncharacterized protein n=1 Tax=Kitasatospora putterlickiae TaxID=221725 RepID=A0ABN1Y4C6_9ACTN